MKLIYILLLKTIVAFISHTTIEDEIIFKNGTKSTIKQSSFKIDYTNKLVRYSTLSNQNVKLNFNEFDSAEFGMHKFQILKINKNILEGYFVLTETNEKKLIIKSEPTEENSNNSIFLLILDHKNEILEEYKLDSNTNYKSMTLRSEIYAVLKYHFPQCTSFLQRLELYDRSITSSNNVRILQFFKTPIYYDYRKTNILK